MLENMIQVPFFPVALSHSSCKFPTHPRREASTSLSLKHWFGHAWNALKLCQGIEQNMDVLISPLRTFLLGSFLWKSITNVKCPLAIVQAHQTITWPVCDGLVLGLIVWCLGYVQSRSHLWGRHKGSRPKGYGASSTKLLQIIPSLIH